MLPIIFPVSPCGLETLSECNGMCICVNSVVNTDERHLTAGWAIQQMHIVQGWKGKRGRQRKASFVLSASGDFPEFLIARLTPQMRARIRDCIVGCSVQNSPFLWKVTAKQAVWLFLGDLTWNAVAKSILVPLLEVKYLRLRTAGPEPEEGSSGSFPTAPHWVLRTAPAGRSQENLWSRMLLRRISWRALANKWQSLSYNWQICSGNRSFPPNSPIQPRHPTSLWECIMASWAAPRFLSSASLCSLGQPFGTFSWTHCAGALSLFLNVSHHLRHCFSLPRSSSARSPYPWTLSRKLPESLSLYNWS